MSSPKIRHNGQMVKWSSFFSRSKKYKYNKQGQLEEITATNTLGDDEFKVAGSKSSLRRMADLERNVSLLITKISTTDGEATDSDDDSFDTTVNKATRFKKSVRHSGNVSIDSGDTLDVNGTLRIDNGLTLGSTAQGVINALIDVKVNAAIDGAPGALNTLNELAAALGDDANFSTTVTNSIATKVSKSGDTMSGNLNMGGNDVTNAGTFHGVSTTAKYADLAERYAADAPYAEGTVVVFGGEAEVTASTSFAQRSVAGVVSTKPAVMMNAEAGNSQTHPFIALQGRVPVKVTGEVKKGDILVASDIAGTATAWDNENADPRMTAYVGIAIADSVDGMVEVKVGK